MRIPWGSRTIEWDGKVLAFLVVVLALSAAIVHYLTHYSSTVPFLTSKAPADWILFPQATRVGGKRVFNAKTTFRKNFAISSKPASAHATFRAMRSGRLRVNGQEIPPVKETHPENRELENWKLEKKADLTGLLQIGENCIEVDVANVGASPALWFSLDMDGHIVPSDSTWEASISGSAWKNCACR
ncbi:MAG: hypothetical protein U1D30_13710 [Planctomycetota bacterium]